MSIVNGVGTVKSVTVTSVGFGLMIESQQHAGISGNVIILLVELWFFISVEIHVRRLNVRNVMPTCKGNR